ncbi:hypothetical protein U7230_14800 [Carboxydochorda subterranea]|uniref:Fructose-bisphosphate aldolase n=1 Tax=Carboxydichorda subterranea TaxID=3109565 RepID=A0ABZ1BX20_9FIRM|nr:hypothetical protein [Limnochorda sp. L945t]WRP17327.1 hypothetical protein U7230_14800 [Limnochorda sp. L945t]
MNRPIDAWLHTIDHPGKRLRMGRLLRPETGRGVIVAMDHGLFVGRPEGLEEVGRTIDRLLPAGPDGVLVTPGMLRHVAGRLAGRGGPGVVLALDTYLTTTFPGKGGLAGAGSGQAHRSIASPEQAAALGADCVKLLLIFGDAGLPAFADNLSFIAQTVEASRRTGVPVMVEPTVWSYPGVPAPALSATQLADMARIAVELGADILKLPFAGPLDEFRSIVRESPVPVMVLGGARTQTPEATLEMARQATEAGAAGLVFGRNVWQHPDPPGLLRQLLQVVHGA